MNCKPGDLVIVVNCPRPFECFDGLIRRVLKPVKSSLGHPAWTYEGAPIKHPDTGMLAECLEDMMLRPIRDPGDDARDETLDWLPVPHKEMA